MTARTQLIYDALKKGPITNHGIISDVNMETLRGIRPIHIKHAIDELAPLGVRIERLDSGGSPSWGMTKDVKPNKDLKGYLRNRYPSGEVARQQEHINRRIREEEA